MKEALFLKLRDEPAWLKPIKTEEPPSIDDLGLELEQGFESTPVPQMSFNDELNGLKLSAVYLDRQEQYQSFEGSVLELKRWVSSVRGDFFDLPVIVIVRGLNMVATRANVPSKQSKHIAQALPFILEDVVADDIDNLHLAMGKRDKEGNIEVVACEKRMIDDLSERFKALDIDITNVVADMSCIGSEPGTWHFVTDGRTLISSIPGESPMSIELDALPILLNSVFRDDPSLPEEERATLPDEIVVTVGSDFTSENLETWLKTRFMGHLADSDTLLNIEHIDEDSFSYLCRQARPRFESGDVIELMQGDLRPSRKRRPSLIPWKPLAGFAAAFVLLFTGYNYLQAAKFNDAHREVDASTRALYKSYFPQDRKIVDIKRQMREKLKGAGGSGNTQQFLTLLTTVGSQLNSMNGLSPLRVIFDESQGDLKIDFLANGFGDLNALKSKLEAQSLQVEIARASQDGEKMKARMNIRSAG